jgi:phosphocarrier protein FPr
MPSQDQPKSRILVAPVTGVITPLSKVPDPTFAQKMVGDGLAVDPAAEALVSPCEGTVTQVHSAGHALTVTTPEGLEVLLHVGLDTVNLNGKGFKPGAVQGQRVKPGDPLVTFDADYVARNAASLLTIMVVTNPERVEEFLPASGWAEAGKTPVLELRLKAAAAAAGAGQASGTSESGPIVILNPSGLHARPSAVLASRAKAFASDVRLVKEDGREGNAKSVVSVMALEVRAHDKVRLVASGPDAVEAVDALAPLLASGLGESIHGKPAQETRKKAERKASGEESLLLGVPASPGLAVGRVFQMRYQDVEVEEKGGDPADERRRLDGAVSKALAELRTLQSGMRQKADAGKAAIFSAHQELLGDPGLLEDAARSIGEGKSAAWAWKRAFGAQADMLARLDDELLSARANDVRDVGRRVLAHLADLGAGTPQFPADAILVAEELTPSDTASMDRAKVRGFAVTGGSATSHASILARAAGIPAVAAVEERALDVPPGTPVILDGDRGELRLNPSEEEVAAARAFLDEAATRRGRELAQALSAAETLDGRRIKVVGNIGGLAEANRIPELGGDGVGLLRSEFLFLQRAVAPSPEEQAEVYTSIAKALGPGRDLVVRTLDVGGDKPLAYLPLPQEMNPFLGVRGIRLNLLGTDLFRAQARAVLSAAPYARLHVMFPMVTSLDELLEAKRIVLEEKAALNVKEDVKIGIMVEVPAAALLAETLAREADFFSVGTNDLTQYTLAIDRGHPRLARFADALHPAVLKLIDLTVRGAHKHGKWVGVCGGVAGDPVAGPVLLGLGVDELSVSGGAIPAVKAMVRSQNYAACQALASRALEMRSAREVRDLLAGAGAGVASPAKAEPAAAGDEMAAA